jgi:hypothetical protein
MGTENNLQSKSVARDEAAPMMIFVLVSADME